MTREEEMKFKEQVKNETVSRKDEIMDAAKRNAAIVSEFIKGAEYADQHPRKELWDAEKVIEWLKNNSHKYVVCDESDFSHYAYNSLIENLHKAMED